MNTLYDLVKKIDALTANSQQVLNALIRSCVAAGSSSGYTVNKYGVKITLDRADIYHLYDFYQSWEAEGFPTEEAAFNSLLARADERWRVNASDTSTLATDAVVKHSMILYMNREQGTVMANADGGEGTSSQPGNDYWLNKIRESASPKGTISTAPIPLNLRTPLYDENLSVKSFSQFETYLFPMGYNRASILGTPGNDDDYIAGGKNWTIDATEFLTLSGNHITMGVNTNPENKLLGYGNKANTISWGNESYAFGDLALAFGDHSIAQGNNSSVFGFYGYGQGLYSFVAGGENDISVGRSTFSTNFHNTAVGSYSFAANQENFAGGWGYRFTFIAEESDAIQTECSVEYIESDDICISHQSVADSTANTALYKVIRISGSAIKYACMPFDMMVGDYVVLYDMWTKINGTETHANDIEGYASDPFISKVTNITVTYKEDSNGVPTDEIDFYEITLDTPYPVDSKYGLFSGGTVSLHHRVVPKHDIDGKDFGTRELLFGGSSTVLGYANASYGWNQTVVGQSSVPNYDAKFIVGTGCSYISGYQDEPPYRANSLVVADTYSYMKLANGKSYIGVSTGLQSIPETYPGSDKLTLNRGTVMRSLDPTTDTAASVTTDADRALMAATKENAIVARVGAGTNLHPYFESDYPTSVLQSLQGTAVIASGSYIERTDGVETARLNLVDTLLADSREIRTADEHGIAIYAEEGIEIRNIANTQRRGITVETCSYLTLTFDGLLLNGKTYRSLPATDKSLSFVLNYQTGAEQTRNIEGVKWGHATSASGFYFIGADSNSHVYDGNIVSSPASASRYDGVNMHLFNSAVQVSGGNYSAVSLAIPATSVYPGGYTARPKITGAETFGDGDLAGNVLNDNELPYLDDVSLWAAAPISDFGYRTLLGTLQDAMVSASDYPENGVVMPVMTCTSVLSGWTDSHQYYAAVKPMSGHKYYSVLMEIWTTDFSDQVVVLELSASINGNTVEIYGAFIFTDRMESTVRGLRVPFVPGFAVHQSFHKFGMPGMLTESLVYRRKNNHLVSYLSGIACNNGSRGTIETSLRTALYGGVALDNGIVAVDIYKSDSSTEAWTQGFPYGFHLHGVVPFETTGDCVGAEFTGLGWQNALKACYKDKVLCTSSDLCTILKDR